MAFPSINVIEEIWKITLWRTHAIAPKSKALFLAYSLLRFREKKEGFCKLENQEELISNEPKQVKLATYKKKE